MSFGVGGVWVMERAVKGGFVAWEMCKWPWQDVENNDSSPKISTRDRASLLETLCLCVQSYLLLHDRHDLRSLLRPL